MNDKISTSNSIPYAAGLDLYEDIHGRSSTYSYFNDENLMAVPPSSVLDPKKLKQVVGDSPSMNEISSSSAETSESYGCVPSNEFHIDGGDSRHVFGTLSDSHFSSNTSYSSGASKRPSMSNRTCKNTSVFANNESKISLSNIPMTTELRFSRETENLLQEPSNRTETTSNFETGPCSHDSFLKQQSFRLEHSSGGTVTIIKPKIEPIGEYCPLANLLSPSVQDTDIQVGQITGSGLHSDDEDITDDFNWDKLL